MLAGAPIVASAMEKINARIAVSEYARRTLVEHLGGDAVVIPNGVDVGYFSALRPRPEWQTPMDQQADGGTIGFVGRFGEPRKGLSVLLEALPAIVEARPRTRLLVAGRGDEDEVQRNVPVRLREHIEFLGMVSDEDKGRLFQSVDVYCAPNTGGESFGIILVEAMSGGAAVLASDLDAFSLVLEDGAAGAMFPKGDAAALAREAIALLGDPARRSALRAAESQAVRKYDWSVVAADILSVYEMVTESTARVTAENGGSR
jgi:phosphatidylinositol alpha-mannosyltransferase